MRLLFLTSRLPCPPDRGDRYRVYNFLRRLSADHEITLVSFIDSERERVKAAQLSEYCAAVHIVRQSPLRSVLAVARNAWRRIPLQVLYYRSRAMERKVDEIASAASFDVVYVHLFRMAPYAERFQDVHKIVDLTDAISQEIKQSLPYRGLFSRALYTIEQARIERYERRVAEACDEAWLIAERDRRVLAQACPSANLHVISNGVDPGEFYPLPTEPDPNALLFVGNMSVRHNVDAVQHLVRDVLPKVQEHVPHAHVTVVGADPVRSIRRLNDHPAVTVTGFVGDLNRALNEASVFIAPLRFAAGVQTKVIEAMAAGRPVVTTSIVNEGIGAVPGRDLLVAGDPQLLADHIVALCRDPGRRKELGLAARRFAVERFRWEDVVDRVRAIEEAGRVRAESWRET